MNKSAQNVTRTEHIEESKAKRVSLVDPFGGVITDGNYTTMIDEPSESVTYVGYAQIGSSVGDSVWQIKKITTSGTIVTVTWANGTDAFTNEWDERVTYAYS